MGNSISLVVMNILWSILITSLWTHPLQTYHMAQICGWHLSYRHMVMKNCKNFVNTSAVSDLPHNLLWEMHLVVLFLNVLVCGNGTTLETKVHWKPHISCYLHSDPNHSYHINWGGARRNLILWMRLNYTKKILQTQCLESCSTLSGLVCTKELCWVW
jgi:hypothetical protein